jgi:UDP-2-acetamido-3-amino-2,3-dideoxy-glucuronate N-acetyltransferase
MVADGAILGDNVKVQNNVAIYTGVVIEDDVFLGPSCVLTNVTNPRSQVVRRGIYETTLIRRGATIGANATVVCGITLGRYVFVAAGAVVTRDFPDYAYVRGVPARWCGWMSRHGHILQFDAAGRAQCPESGFRYERLASPESRYTMTGSWSVRCLDLDEEAPLPAHLTSGTRCYDEFKPPPQEPGMEVSYQRHSP